MGLVGGGFLSGGWRDEEWKEGRGGGGGFTDYDQYINRKKKKILTRFRFFAAKLRSSTIIMCAMSRFDNIRRLRKADPLACQP